VLLKHAYLARSPAQVEYVLCSHILKSVLHGGFLYSKTRV
jgi:hypothetical protein